MNVKVFSMRNFSAPTRGLGSVRVSALLTFFELLTVVAQV